MNNSCPRIYDLYENDPVTCCLFPPSVSGRVRAVRREVRDQITSLPRAVRHQAAARHADLHLPQRAGGPGVGHRHDLVTEGSPQRSELTLRSRSSEYSDAFNSSDAFKSLSVFTVAGIASQPTEDSVDYLKPVEQSAALSLSAKGERDEEPVLWLAS